MSSYPSPSLAMTDVELRLSAYFQEWKSIFLNFIILLTLRFSFPNLRSFSFIKINIIIFFVKYICCLITNTKTLQINPSVNPSSPIAKTTSKYNINIIKYNIYQFRVTLDTPFTMKFFSYSLKYSLPIFNQKNKEKLQMNLERLTLLVHVFFLIFTPRKIDKDKSD